MKNRGANFWMRKKVLITGYAGFLGSWLTKRLLEKGADITGIDIEAIDRSPILKDFRNRMKTIKADVADLKAIKRAIDNFKPEIIFHLAAQAIVAEAVKNPVRTLSSNIEGTWNILEASRNRRFVKAVVVASSDKAYGSHKKLPYTEAAPLKGEYPYDVSKSCADLLAYSYFKTYGLPVCVTRCGNIFGPGDLHFSRIVPDAMRSIVKNKRLLIRSDGKFTRDYIFVDDVASGYILLAEKMCQKDISGQAFNFSNESPLSVIELFERIIALSPGYNIIPKILNRAKCEIHNQYLSARKSRSMLGWKSRYTFDKAIRETLSWYRSTLSKKS